MHAKHTILQPFLFVAIAANLIFATCGTDLTPHPKLDAAPPAPPVITPIPCSCPTDSLCQFSDLLTAPSVPNYINYDPSDKLLTMDVYGLLGIYSWGNANLTIAINPVKTIDQIDGGGTTGGIGVNYSFTPVLGVAQTMGNSVYHVYRGWLSIRKEYAIARNLCGCTGVRFDTTTLIQDAALRITVADLVDGNDVGKPTDELWWYEIPELQRNEPRATASLINKSIRADFKSFNLSNGYGARKNNRLLELGCVAAIEFNLVYESYPNCEVESKTPCPPITATGQFEIRNLTAY